MLAQSFSLCMIFFFSTRVLGTFIGLICRTAHNNCVYIMGSKLSTAFHSTWNTNQRTNFLFRPSSTLRSSVGVTTVILLVVVASNLFQLSTCANFRATFSLRLQSCSCSRPCLSSRYI